MNKTLNLIIMLLMIAFAVYEGYDIAHRGPDVFNVLFLLLFSAFAVRRFLMMSKLS